MALDTEKIIADLKEASILELNDLVKAIEDEFGVSAATAELVLKDAKVLVDGAPSVIKEGVAKDEAEEIKAKLEEVGAQVTLK